MKCVCHVLPPPPQACELLVPSWCLETVMEPLGGGACWKKHITGDRLWGFTAWPNFLYTDEILSLCFLRGWHQALRHASPHWGAICQRILPQQLQRNWAAGPRCQDPLSFVTLGLVPPKYTVWKRLPALNTHKVWYFLCSVYCSEGSLLCPWPVTVVLSLLLDAIPFMKPSLGFREKLLYVSDPFMLLVVLMLSYLKAWQWLPWSQHLLLIRTFEGPLCVSSSQD